LATAQLRTDLNNKVPFPRVSESMGNHDPQNLDAASVRAVR